MNEDSINQQLAEDFTRHRLWLLRYEAGTARDVVELWEETVAPLKAELERLRRLQRSGRTELTPSERFRYRQAQLAFQATLQAAEQAIAEVLTERLEEVRETELRITASRIETRLPAAVGAEGIAVASVPASDALVSITSPVGGLRWTDRLARDLVEAEQAVRAAIADAVITGSSMPNAAQLLEDVTGIRETYKGRFATIARTEIQRVGTESALLTYQANSDIIEGVIFLATLDSKTCPVCAPRHMAFYPLGPNGRPMDSDDPKVPPFIAPPIHPRCRCFLAPVTKSWRDLGIDAPDDNTRRRLDGARPENMSYDAWLRRQPHAVQEAVLGKARARLWRGRNVALRDLSDRGRALSLGDLRRLYPDRVPADVPE